MTQPKPKRKDILKEFYKDLKQIAEYGRSYQARKVYYKYLHLIDRRYNKLK